MGVGEVEVEVRNEAGVLGSEKDPVEGGTGRRRP